MGFLMFQKIWELVVGQNQNKTEPDMVNLASLLEIGMSSKQNGGKLFF